MGLGVQSKNPHPEEIWEAAKLVHDMISKDAIVIFSKTRCPFCKMAKDAFNAVQAEYTVIELDTREDGNAIQSALGKITGASTVPRVFIRGQFLGGGSEIKALFESGNLIPLLKNLRCL